MEDNRFTDRIKEIEAELLDELLAEIGKLISHLARTHTIPSYDSDDLEQELSIRLWQVIQAGKYDPERSKPSTFFYRVFKNHLINLYTARKNANKDFKDNLDHAERLGAAQPEERIVL